MGMVVITIHSFSKGKHNQICHEDTKSQSLMNAKCRVQNAKVKMKKYKTWSKAIPQFCNLHFEI